jgi:hypothetical protein
VVSLSLTPRTALLKLRCPHCGGLLIGEGSDTLAIDTRALKPSCWECDALISRHDVLVQTQTWAGVFAWLDSLPGAMAGIPRPAGSERPPIREIATEIVAALSEELLQLTEGRPEMEAMLRTYLERVADDLVVPSNGAAHDVGGDA